MVKHLPASRAPLRTSGSAAGFSTAQLFTASEPTVGAVPPSLKKRKKKKVKKTPHKKCHHVLGGVNDSSKRVNLKMRDLWGDSRLFTLDS